MKCLMPPHPHHHQAKISMHILYWAFQVALLVRNPLVNAGDRRNTNSIPGSGRFPGGGHGNPLQCSCLENPLDRGARRTTVHAVAKRDRAEVTQHAHTRSLYQESVKLSMLYALGGT